jgi:hypothetical protein
MLSADITNCLNVIPDRRSAQALGLSLDKLVDSLGIVSIKKFGAVGNGNKDCWQSLSDAVESLSKIASWPSLPTGALNRPTLFFPAGVYYLSLATIQILFNGFRVCGEGNKHTTIAIDSTSDIPLFDIGTFSTTPADIFAGAIDAHFEGLRIQNVNGRTIDNRTGQGIRCSGSGGLILIDTDVSGFKYGVNCPYGGDFNYYGRVKVSSCDVGVYQGPGGQQFLSHRLDISNCPTGMVLDRPGQCHFELFNGGNCRDRVVLLEGITDTSTRFCSTIPTSGTSFQSKIVFDSPFFEGNAGGGGDVTVPTHYIENNNGGSDAYRDIVINDPIIWAGSATKTTTSFFANTGGLAAQRVYINSPVFIGSMTEWLLAPGASTVLNNIRVANGSTAPALSSTATNYSSIESNGLTERYAALPALKTYESGDATNGIQTSYGVNGIFRMAFRSGGSYLYRFGVDVQNKRLFLGDPSANEFSFSFAASIPTSGTYAIGSFVWNSNPTVAGGKTLLGWQRLTTGSGHVAGTDWHLSYVSNT